MYLSRRSWHYWIVAKVFPWWIVERAEKDFCAYWRYFLLASVCLIFIAGVAFLAAFPPIVLIASGLGLISPDIWAIASDSTRSATFDGSLFAVLMTFGIAIDMILAGIALVWISGWAIERVGRFLERDRYHGHTPKADKPASLFKVAWRSFKDKVCPLVEWK